MSKHYIIRVSDGINFINSSNLAIWGIKKRQTSFIKNVKKGDKLWFVKNKLKGDQHTGKIIAVTDFVSMNKRNTGPLLSITPNNDELGWDKEKGSMCDIEIHYNNLYDLTNCNLHTKLKGQTTICNYENVLNSIQINLIVEYENVSTKYENISKTMLNNNVEKQNNIKKNLKGISKTPCKLFFLLSHDKC